jgi:hypothetical protein
MRVRVFWPVLFIATVALIPSWRFVFGGYVPAPVDQIHSLPPWNGPPSPNEWDALQADGALQFLPWRHYMLDSMRHGFVPLWNPYTFGGTPFLANSQSAPLYPLHWIWPFGAESLLSFSAWLHLVIAGLGVYLLCKRLGADDKGAAIAGSAMTLSAFMAGWMQLSSVSMTASWIPWCLSGVLRLFDEPRAKNVAKLGACIALMLLAGHLQIAAYGILATVLAMLWLAVLERAPRLLMHSAVALLLGSSLASPQLIPVIENLREGHRVAKATEDGWSAYRSQAVTPQMLVTVFDPLHYGHPQWGEGLTGYWLSWQQPGRNYAESAWYIGPAMVPLALLGLLRSRRNARAGLMACLCALGLLIALGTIVAQAAYFYVPGWSGSGSPGRAAILFAIGMCTLAGLAFPRQDDAPKKWQVLAAFLLGAAGLIWAYFTSGAHTLQMQNVEVVSKSDIGFTLMISIPALLAFLCFGLGPPKYRGAATAFLAATQIALLGLVHHDLNPGSPRGRYVEPFAEMQHLRGQTVAVVNENWSLFGPGAGVSAPPNSLLPYGVVEIGGYDSAIPKKTKEVLDKLNKEDSAPAANGNMLFVKPRAGKEDLRALGVDYVISAYNLALPVEHDFGNWRLYRVPGARPVSPVIASRYNEKTLAWNEKRNSSKAWLASSDADGWEMSMLSFDYSRKTVTAVYRPHSYRLGFLLALFGVSALVALLCWKDYEPASSS